MKNNMGRDIINKKKWRNSPEQKAKAAAYAKQYAIDHKEDVARRKKEWADANPDRVKNSVYKRLYGITIDERNLLSLKQNGNCAICGINESHLDKPLYIDHCHKTGKVRGLICQKCNSALGLFDDDPNNLINGYKYLIGHSSIDNTEDNKE